MFNVQLVPSNNKTSVHDSCVRREVATLLQALKKCSLIMISWFYQPVSNIYRISINRVLGGVHQRQKVATLFCRRGVANVSLRVFSGATEPKQSLRCCGQPQQICNFLLHASSPRNQMALCQLSANLVTDVSARTTRQTFWVSIFFGSLR